MDHVLLVRNHHAGRSHRGRGDGVQRQTCERLSQERGDVLAVA